jgi:riboflavin synthase
MFTGIIEETGKVLTAVKVDGGLRLDVQAETVLQGTSNGDSICVDGVCLTVESFSQDRFTCFVSAETLEMTTLEKAVSGRVVNLERAMAAGDRFGGHMVSGHVEGMGRITRLQPAGEGYVLSVDFSPEFRPYVVHKGSISVDGVSLTVAAVENGGFRVAMIPETWENTTFRLKTIGDFVNLEPDLILKYVRSAVEGLLGEDKDPGLTMEMLVRAGFAADRKG